MMTNADAKRGLEILAGCPEGATLYALELCGIPDGAMAELVARRLARVLFTRPARLKGVTIPRFFITDEGRRAA